MAASGVNNPFINRNHSLPAQMLLTGAVKVKNGLVSLEGMLEKKVWPYIKEGNNVVKHTLKIVKVQDPSLAPELSRVVARLGLLSIVGLVFTIRDTIFGVPAIIASIRLRDIEGLALNAIAMVVNAFDMIDSGITIHAALESFSLVPKILFFSTIGMPIGVFLLVSSTLLTGYKTMWNVIELFRLRNMNKMTPGQLQEYMKERIGITAKERCAIDTKVIKKCGLDYRQDLSKLTNLEAPKQAEVKAALKKYETRLVTRKEKILTRHTGDARIVNIMKNMRKELEKNPQQVDLPDNVKSAVWDMRKVIAVHGLLNATTVIINTARLSVLIATLAAGPAVPVLISPLLSLGNAAFKIGKHTFSLFLMKYVVSNREWAKPPEAT